MSRTVKKPPILDLITFENLYPHSDLPGTFFAFTGKDHQPHGPITFIPGYNSDGTRQTELEGYGFVLYHSHHGRYRFMLYFRTVAYEKSFKTRDEAQKEMAYWEKQGKITVDLLWKKDYIMIPAYSHID